MCQQVIRVMYLRPDGSLKCPICKEKLVVCNALLPMAIKEIAESTLISCSYCVSCRRYSASPIEIREHRKRIATQRGINTNNVAFVVDFRYSNGNHASSLSQITKKDTSITIAGTKFEQIPRDKALSADKAKNVWLTVGKFIRCPICSEKLHNYTTVIPISKKTCIKYEMSVCFQCDVYFSHEHKLLKKLANMCVKNNQLLIHDVYRQDIDKYQSLADLQSIPSAYCRVVMSAEDQVRIITIVTQHMDVSPEKDCFHYTNRPMQCLLADLRGKRKTVLYHGKRFVIQDCHYVDLEKKDAQGLNSSISNSPDAELDWRWLEMNPYADEDNTLYVHKGAIICLRQKHEIEQATAILKDLAGDDIELNVNHCVICDRYFIHHTLYTRYQKKYGTILGEVRFIDHDSMESFNTHMSEESTLHLCGYSVRKTSKLKTGDRQTIIATVIDNGAMTKQQVIDLLRYLIDLNKSKENWELAVEKWEDDLDFTLAYNTENQNRYTIRKIAPYCRNHFVIIPKKPNIPIENKKCAACRFSQKTPSLIYNICTNSDAPRYYQRCEMCSYFEDTL